jgi:hypothetical protein
MDPTISAALTPSSSRMGSTMGSRGVVRVPQQRIGLIHLESRCIKPPSWGIAETMPAPTKERMERTENLILMDWLAGDLEKREDVLCKGLKAVVVNDIQIYGIS